MIKIRLLLSVLRAFVLLVLNPTKTDEVLRLADEMHRAGLYDLAIEKLTRDEKVGAIFRERFVRGILDLNQLAKLPNGTLGKEFVNFVTRNNLDPNYFYQKTRILKNDHDYYEVRVRETHDIWHVALGFEADEIGEIGVQGFMLAQYSPPLSAFLVGGGFFRYLFKYPAKLFDYTQSLSKGFQIGLNSPQFFAEKWEENWDEPLVSLRARLNVPSEPRAHLERQILHSDFDLDRP